MKLSRTLGSPSSSLGAKVARKDGRVEHLSLSEPLRSRFIRGLKRLLGVK